MRKLWLLAAAASLLLVARAPQVQAQSASVVATCGSITLPTGYANAPITQDVNGALCTNASGGGGGGAVTVANGADVAEGATTDSAATIGSTGTVSAKLRTITTELNTLNTTLGTPIQATGGTVGLVAGSAVIGHVINDASSAVIGHVIADTGSTTAVTALPALPTGSNVIGHVIADTGSTTAVTALPATPAGSSIIGKVGIDQTTPGTTNLVALTPAQVGAGATGSAVPANADYLGTSQSAVLKGVTGCDTHAFYDASDNGKKTVVAGVSSKKTYICGFVLATGGTATNLSLTSGTGTDCVTTSTAITPAYQLVANDRVGANSPFWNGLITLANADNLCVNASAGNAHQVEVWYTVQ